MSSTALGDAVRYAGDGAVRERVQRILHAVAAGGRTATAKYDSGGREDDLTDGCRCLVSWGVLSLTVVAAWCHGVFWRCGLCALLLAFDLVGRYAMIR